MGRIPEVSEILDILLSRLGDKGLKEVQCRRLLKDVFNIIARDGNFTLPYINREMEKLG